jgi:hypothetical protein
MNLVEAAQSGHGKGLFAQSIIEQNIDDYDATAILDFKDEYKGLVKSDLASYFIVGPDELSWSPNAWKQLLEQNGAVVFARHEDVGVDEWREVCGRIVEGARKLDSVLVVVDEAHFVAPQSGKVPESLTGLATTGRGEGASSIWITQRLAKMEEDIVSQCQARILGAFESDADLDKVAGIVEYPDDLHNPQHRVVHGVPDDLVPDDHDGAGAPALRKFFDEDGNIIGSEWIYSDNTGARRRVNTGDIEMESEHVGAQGNPINIPGIDEE